LLRCVGQVRPGGLAVIDDLVMAHGAGERIRDDERRWRLESRHDAVIVEREGRQDGEDEAQAPRDRAEDLAAMHPERAPPLPAFAAAQEAEYSCLAEGTITIVWRLLRAVATTRSGADRSTGFPPGTGSLRPDGA
jgi:hypothetical protein